MVNAASLSLSSPPIPQLFEISSFEQNKDKDYRMGAWSSSSTTLTSSSSSNEDGGGGEGWGMGGGGGGRWGGGGGGGIGGKVASRSRTVEYSHPVKTKFPGMPSHAKTFKKQGYAFDAKRGVLDIREELRFEGIPKADCFKGESAVVGAGSCV